MSKTKLIHAIEKASEHERYIQDCIDNGRCTTVNDEIREILRDEATREAELRNAKARKAEESAKNAEKLATLKQDLAKSETAEQRAALLEVLDAAQLKIFAENEFITVNKRLGKKKLIAEIVKTITARFNDIDAGSNIFVRGFAGLPTMLDTPLIDARKKYITAKYESLAEEAETGRTMPEEITETETQSPAITETPAKPQFNEDALNKFFSALYEFEQNEYKFTFRHILEDEHITTKNSIEKKYGWRIYVFAHNFFNEIVKHHSDKERRKKIREFAKPKDFANGYLVEIGIIDKEYTNVKSLQAALLEIYLRYCKYDEQRLAEEHARKELETTAETETQSPTMTETPAEPETVNETEQPATANEKKTETDFISLYVEMLEDINDFDEIIAAFKLMTDNEFDLFARRECIDIRNPVCKHPRETQQEIAAKELITRFELISRGKLFVKYGNTYSHQEFYTPGKSSDDYFLNGGIVTPLMEAQYNKLGHNDFVMKAKIMYCGCTLRPILLSQGIITAKTPMDFAGMIETLKSIGELTQENKNDLAPDFVRTIEYVQKNYPDKPEPPTPDNDSSKKNNTDNETTAEPEQTTAPAAIETETGTENNENITNAQSVED